MFIFWKKWVKAWTHLLSLKEQACPQTIPLPTTVVLQPQGHLDNAFSIHQMHENISYWSRLLMIVSADKRKKPKTVQLSKVVNERETEGRAIM